VFRVLNLYHTPITKVAKKSCQKVVKKVVKKWQN
jgi:hypothetical protein